MTVGGDVDRAIATGLFPSFARDVGQEHALYYNENRLEDAGQIKGPKRRVVEIFEAGAVMFKRGPAYYLPWHNSYILHMYWSNSDGHLEPTAISTWSQIRNLRPKLDVTQERLLGTVNVIRRDLLSYEPAENDVAVALFSISNFRNSKKRVFDFIRRQRHFIGAFPSPNFQWIPESTGNRVEGGHLVTSVPGGVFKDHLYDPSEFLGLNVDIVPMMD